MKSYPVLVFHLGEPSPAVHAVSCANDAEATLRAINLGQSRMEVWDRARRVASIPAQRHIEPTEIDAGAPGAATASSPPGGKGLPSRRELTSTALLPSLRY